MIKWGMGGRVFRWGGGSFIAVWNNCDGEGYVPDDMIQLPESLVQSRVTAEDLTVLVEKYTVQMGARACSPCE